MRSQTFISVLVFCVAFAARVVSNDTIHSQKFDLANKLNTLVRHSGWRSMDYVKISKHRNHSCTTEDPMSAILEAVSSNRDPFDLFNVLEKYDDLFTVLKCKYVEVIYKCRSLVQHLIRVCRNEKTKDHDETTTNDNSVRNYHDCFRLLLIKLHSLSSRLKCMTDALEYVHSIGLQWRPKSCIKIAAEKLTEYTSTVGPRTSARFSQQDLDEQVIDVEIRNISEYFLDVINLHVNGFSRYYCNISSHRYCTTQTLNEQFKYKKSHQLIPEHTTMVQYVRDEMDDYITDILDSCFFDLGFAHDLAGNVTIRDI